MMGIIRRTALGMTVGVIGLSLAGLPAAATASAAAAGWQISYNLPSQNGGSDSVSAIAATGTSNAWALGGKLVVVQGQAQGAPAAFHWNGTSWSPGKLPGPLPEGAFSAVSAPSATDIWAVGGCEYCTPFAASRNGTQWTWHSNAASTDDSSMAAFSPSNAWVADYTDIDHWNGKSWRHYKAIGWNGVWSISGVAYNDIWAAGLAVGGTQPEALHWNGSSWQATSIPAISLPANGEAVPAGVLAESADNVWEGGYIEWPDTTTGLTDYEPFMLHWNGTAWSQQSIPDSLPQDYGFVELAPDGTGGFWAVDEAVDSGEGGLPQYLVHYSDGNWTQTGVPAPAGATSTYVAALSGVAGSQDMWASIAYENAQGDPVQAIASYTP